MVPGICCCLLIQTEELSFIFALTLYMAASCPVMSVLHLLLFLLSSTMICFFSRQQLFPNNVLMDFEVLEPPLITPFFPLFHFFHLL